MFTMFSTVYSKFVGYTILRWRLLRRPIIAKPDNVVGFTKAAIALHNFLRTTESTVYCPPGFVDGEDGEGNLVRGSWREGEGSSMTSVTMTSSNRSVSFIMSTGILKI